MAFYKRKLKFDFGIQKDNKWYLIEYQGGQHYQKCKFYGGEKQFIKTQKRDQIKRDFCKNKNISLLEIPYWEFNNMDKLIKEFINLS